MTLRPFEDAKLIPHLSSQDLPRNPQQRPPTNRVHVPPRTQENTSIQRPSVEPFDTFYFLPSPRNGSRCLRDKVRELGWGVGHEALGLIVRPIQPRKRGGEGRVIWSGVRLKE